MPTYRLLRGNHDESIVEKRDPRTNEILRHPVKKFHKQGEVFFSENPNLCRHNIPNAPKFEKISDDNIVDQVAEEEETNNVDLSTMKLTELRSYAEERGVATAGLNKAELIEAIEEALTVG